MASLNFHEDWWPVPPQTLSHSFKGVHLKALHIHLEERDRRESIGGEKVVAAHNLDWNRLGRGVVG